MSLNRLFVCFSFVFFAIPFSGSGRQIVVTSFTPNNSGLSYEQVRCIEKDIPRNGWWIGTEWGLNFFDGQTSWNNWYKNNSDLPDNNIRCLALDTSGFLWIGTFTEGLARFDGDTSWTIFNTQNSPLPDDHIRTIAIDYQQAVWIGTTGGLARYFNGSWQVWSMFSHGIGGNNITSITFQHDTIVWIGTINGGLNKLVNNQFQIFNSQNSFIPDNSMLHLAFDAQNLLWIGTPAAALALFNGTTWLNFNNASSGIGTSSVNRVLPLGNSKAWLTSPFDGLIYYGGGTDWTQFNTQNSPLPENTLLEMKPDSDGTLWLGSQTGGLLHIRFNDTFFLEDDFYPVSCFGSNDAQIVVTPTGGTAPYSFLWNDGSVQNNLSGLGPGNYSVTSTDAYGFTATFSFSVMEPDPVLTTLQVVTTGEGTGDIYLSVLGGAAPYQFNWSNGATSDTLLNMPSGTYSVTVLDQNGCLAVDSVDANFTSLYEVQLQELSPKVFFFSESMLVRIEFPFPAQNRVGLYDLHGRLLAQKQNGENPSFSTANLPAGVYLIAGEWNNRFFQKKLPVY